MSKPSIIFGSSNRLIEGNINFVAFIALFLLDVNDLFPEKFDFEFLTFLKCSEKLNFIFLLEIILKIKNIKIFKI